MPFTDRQTTEDRERGKQDAVEKTDLVGLQCSPRGVQR